MIVQNKIDKLLRDNLNVSKLIIRNDSNKHNVPPNSESHFNVQIVSDDFKDLSQIQRHKIVYRALGDLMKHEIHALSMKTLTIKEWKNL